MTLRDRLRRWWSPAQWEDDHPAERKQRAQPNKNALGGFGETGEGDRGWEATRSAERDFKKPR
jgi:hypothetical protein